MATRTRTVKGLDGTETTETYEIPDEQDRAEILTARAHDALATNTAFLALASPTNAQTLTQVKALTRECSAIIRLMMGRLESAD